jgi:peptidoglycan/xylan/chitin deacetylase (PgdA/CDA1 family)
METFLNEYAGLKAGNRQGLKELLRSTALDLLYNYSRITADLSEAFRKPRIQFLYIHHVFTDEEESFRKLLSFLSKDHIFISYTEAWQRIINNQIDKPYIAFSSDDGMKNNLRASKILESFGATACFFICPDIIDEKNYNSIAAFSKDKLHFPPVEFMSWQDIFDLKKSGHEIGSHTMSHINVSKTDPTKLEYEIGESKRILDTRCGKTIHFAYPYGRHFHFSSTGKKIVFENGYLSCASAERGCHVHKKEGNQDYKEILIRRDHIILNWPLQHIEYFLFRNIQSAAKQKNSFPDYEDRNTY